MQRTALRCDGVQMGASGIAVLLLGIIPLDMPIVETVDSIETSNFYDENAKLVFRQRIFRNFNPHTNTFEIVDWRLIKDERNYVHDKRLTFHDGQVMREVRAISAYTTHFQHDPELVERELLPKEMRRELTRPVSTKRAHELLKKLQE